MEHDALTAREREVLALATRGLTNKAIALQLGISENAVRYHLKELHSKLGTDGDRAKLTRGRWLGHAWAGLLAARTAIAPAAVAMILLGSAFATLAILGALAEQHETPAIDSGLSPIGEPIAAIDSGYAELCREKRDEPNASAAGTGARGGLEAGYQDVMRELGRGFAIRSVANVHVPFNDSQPCGVSVTATVTPETDAAELIGGR